MSVMVRPDAMTAAAGVVAGLQDVLATAPNLGSAAAAATLNGSAVGNAIVQSDGVSTQARRVIAARYNQFASLLALSAITFDDTDLAAAERISQVADLNSAAGGN